MGTHPSGPAKLTSAAGTLKAWIEQNPSSLGEKTFERWGPELPFLLKVGLRSPWSQAEVGGCSDHHCVSSQVLSVQTALSIQSHPDKKLAEKLHASDPKVGALYHLLHCPHACLCTSRRGCCAATPSLIH